MNLGMTDKPRIGISSCLLGEPVRYDGRHQLDRYLHDTLGAFVDYVPVCPETECGLGVPRPAMRLVATEAGVRLLTRQTGEDMTPKMAAWLPGRLAELGRLRLCGFIFKARSPSSGLKRVKIYDRDGTVQGYGSGLFAGALAGALPHLPVEEEGRLQDSRLRENFIERIFLMQRWHALTTGKNSLGRLIAFHAAHKYLLMAHCPKTLREMGALLARGKDYPLGELHERYLALLTRASQKLATVSKNTNVLHHILGYFKKELGADDKAELLEIIERYHAEQVPLVVPLTLINHYVRRYRPEYLLDQVYLNPHPLELMLRNHV